MKGKHEGVKKDILYIILEHYTHHMIVIALTWHFVILQILVLKLKILLEFYHVFTMYFLIQESVGKFLLSTCNIPIFHVCVW